MQHFTYLLSYQTFLFSVFSACVALRFLFRASHSEPRFLKNAEYPKKRALLQCTDGDLYTYMTLLSQQIPSAISS